MSSGHFALLYFSLRPRVSPFFDCLLLVFDFRFGADSPIQWENINEIDSILFQKFYPFRKWAYFLCRAAKRRWSSCSRWAVTRWVTRSEPRSFPPTFSSSAEFATSEAATQTLLEVTCCSCSHHSSPPPIYNRQATPFSVQLLSPLNFNYLTSILLSSFLNFVHFNRLFRIWPNWKDDHIIIARIIGLQCSFIISVSLRTSTSSQMTRQDSLSSAHLSVLFLCPFLLLVPLVL